jgi:hypothetical protein
MNLQNCPRFNPFHNVANFGGRIDTIYTGIIGGKNKIDQAKIKIDFELINFRHNPNKSVFSFRKKRSGPFANEPLGE